MGAEVERSILGDGCIVEPDARIIHSVVGLRSIVREVRCRPRAGALAGWGGRGGRGLQLRGEPWVRTSTLLAPPPSPCQGCVIEDSMLMGADFYEQYEECEAFSVRGAPGLAGWARSARPARGGPEPALAGWAAGLPPLS